MCILAAPLLALLLLPTSIAAAGEDHPRSKRAGYDGGGVREIAGDAGVRIAVTGSNGKIGTAVVGRLREDGHDVVGFDIGAGRGPTFTRVELRDYGQALDALLGVTARHDGIDALVEHCRRELARL